MLSSILRDRQSSVSPTNSKSISPINTVQRQTSVSSTTSDISGLHSSYKQTALQRQLSGRCCSFLPFESIQGGSDNAVTRSTTESLFTRIGAEHRTMEQYLLSIKNYDKKFTENEVLTYKQLLMNLVHKHIQTCTMLLQPAVKKYVIDSQRWVVHMSKESDSIDTKLAQLKANMNNKQLYKELKSLIKQHIRDEESITLEWLSRRMSTEQMNKLSAQFNTMLQSHHSIHTGSRINLQDDTDISTTSSAGHSRRNSSAMYRSNSYAELFSDFERAGLSSFTETHNSVLDNFNALNISTSTDTTAHNSPTSMNAQLQSPHSNSYVRPRGLPPIPQHVH